MHRDNTVSILRFLAVVLALGLVASAVFIDEIGFGAAPGAGRFQIIAASLAALLMTLALLGRRFGSLYKGLGLILLNLVVLAAAVELLSFAAVNLTRNIGIIEPGSRGDDASSAILIENRAALRYEPFITWSLAPGVDDQSMRVDEDGCRPVPGASQDTSAFQVFVYGSEAVLGAMVGDSATIPFFIQRSLDSLLTRPARVVNRARPGWVSTQAVIDLALEIRSGNIPDLVVFIGGFDDVAAAWQDGSAGAHMDLAAMRGGVEGGTVNGDEAGPWLRLLESTSAWNLISSLIPGENGESEPDDGSSQDISTEALAGDVAGVIAGNAELAGRLGQLYGFDCRFFWQPCVWEGQKALAEAELEMLDGGEAGSAIYGTDGEFLDLLHGASAAVASTEGSTPGIIMLKSVFDSIPGQVFIGGSGVEMNATGNEMVARAVVSELAPVIPR